MTIELSPADIKAMRATMAREGRKLRQRVQQQASDARRQWAKLHPDQAAAERALRKQAALLEEAHGHRRGGTAMTIEVARRGARGGLARLWRDGVIDDDQLAWASEIAGVAERIGADVTVRTASMETRIDSSAHGDVFFERLGEVRRERAYSDWRRTVARVGHVGAVLDMIVGEPLSIAGAASKYRISRRRAIAALREALNLWPAYAASAHRSISAEDVEDAHRRLEYGR